MVHATPARRGRVYREHGRTVTDVELHRPGTNDTVIVEIRSSGVALVHDSRASAARQVDDAEAEIESFKAAGYVESAS